MYITVLGNPTYCYTGGKPFDAAKPTVIFIHGVLNDHSVWILQTRYLAHHGFNVLAVDLPGHGKSAGPNRDIAPCRTVESAADFIIALLDAAGIKTAALVGHSFGSLIALEAAARAPEIPAITHLAIVGTAFPMPCLAALLETSSESAAQSDRHGQHLLAQHASAAALGAGARHVAVRQLQSTDAARAGQQCSA